MLRVRKSVVLLATFAASVGLLTSSTATASPEATVQGSSVTRASSLEELVLQEVNALRTARRLPRLATSSSLARSAAAHSRAMATYGFFAHESRDGTAFSRRIKQYYLPRSNGWTVGENLAMFGGSPPTASAIVDAWMGSPAHRANLLRGIFREAGVGVMFNPAAGGVFGGEPTWIVTLDLGNR